MRKLTLFATDLIVESNNTISQISKDKFLRNLGKSQDQPEGASEGRDQKDERISGSKFIMM
jgi:hypothetical protein